MADYLKITQNGSVIGSRANQRATLRGLGLRHRGAVAFVVDNDSTRGMVKTVAHIVSCEEATKKERNAALKAKPVASFELVEKSNA